MSTTRTHPECVELLNRVAREKSARPVRFRKLEVHDYKATSVLPGRQIALSGTVTLFVGRKDGRLFRDLKTAVLEPSRGDDTSVAAELNHYFARRKPKDLAELVACIRSETLIADLCYGGATLVENILLPEDAEIAAIPLPYNGGRLADGGFSLSEHYLEHVDANVDVLLVRHEPPLTEAERAALERVPEEMVAINVGRGPGDVACSVLLLTVAVVVEVAVVAATFTVAKALDDHSMDHINPISVENLGPVGTARALTNLRRDILQGRTGQW